MGLQLDLGPKAVKTTAKRQPAGASFPLFVSVKVKMEFMSSLQNGFDDHKPSLFGTLEFEIQVRATLC